MRTRSTGTPGLARHGALALAGMVLALALALALLASGAPLAAAAQGAVGTHSSYPYSNEPEPSASTTVTKTPATNTPVPPTLTNTPVPPTATPSPTPVPTQPAATTNPTDCLYPPSSGNPLRFCAPVYDNSGNAEGPNSTRVIVIGELSKDQLPLDALYFVKEGTFPLPDNAHDLPGLSTCVHQATSANNSTMSAVASATAFAVMCDHDIQEMNTTTPGQPFVWNFTLNAPAGADNQTYTLRAIYLDAKGTPTAVNGMDTFEVLSSSPPCVVAGAAAAPVNGKSCPTQSPVFLNPGGSVTIQGANWLPAGQISVEVTAQCITCSQQVLTLSKNVNPVSDSGQPDDGTFSFQATIPTAITGIYSIQAWSVVSDPKPNPANGALSYPGDASALTSVPALVVGKPSVDVEGAGSSCSPASCTFQPGTGVSLTGQYWMTGPLVYLEYTSKKCNEFRESTLPYAVVTPNTVGTFQTHLSLAGLKDGTTYKVCADTVTAPHEVTIGPPDTSGPAQTVAWLALLLGVASLGLYIFRPRRQGFVR